MKSALFRFMPLLLLAALLIIFLSLHGYRYLTFANLKEHRYLLLAWGKQHIILLVLSYCLIYTAAIACPIPGAAFLTLAGGFLFGPVLGTCLTVFSATLGAFLVFRAVELALSKWMAQKTAKYIQKMVKGFQKNAFSYLLVLRLIPLFPFWLVNIVPALLGVSKRIFILATFLGIIPGTFIFVMIGNGLGRMFDNNQDFNLKVMSDPQVWLPLLALALLSLLPVAYQFIRNKKHG